MTELDNSTPKDDIGESERRTIWTSQPYALVRTHSAFNSVSSLHSTDKLIELSKHIVYSGGRPDIAVFLRILIRQLVEKLSSQLHRKSLVATVRDFIERLSD